MKECLVCSGKLNKAWYQPASENYRRVECLQCVDCGQKQWDGKLVGIRVGQANPDCVHCGSDRTVKNGFYNSHQRYRCRDCGRTFNH